LVEDWRAVKVYACSTARAGVGCVKDSGRTPVGWHRVAAKIGDGLPVGAVLKEREWTGEIWGDGRGHCIQAKEVEIIPPPPFGVLPLEKGESFTDGDLILSRILWLEGLEAGKNRGGDVDTRSRYIYIHGTNRIDELGRPASGGCIRMAPTDVIELYNAVAEGCCILITKE
jgi:UDP-N-acetylmuramate--alanine ligase